MNLGFWASHVRIITVNLKVNVDLIYFSRQDEWSKINILGAVSNRINGENIC